MVLCALTPGAAGASALVVGEIRDTAGYPVAGADIRVLDGHGAVVGSARSSLDGTFGADARGTPVAVRATCDYCANATVRLSADLRAVVVVRRWAVMSATGLAADDVAVLPYRNVTQLAGLIPFAVAQPYGISDRGLARGDGVLAVDGQSPYRALDGVDPATQLPAHTPVDIVVAPPSLAGAYGGRASGGLFSVDTLGVDGPLARADAGGGYDVLARGGSTVRASYGLTNDDGLDQRGIVASTPSLGGGTLDVRASSSGVPLLNASTIGAAYNRAAGPGLLSASVALGRSHDPLATEDDRSAALLWSAGGATVGLRTRRSTGDLPFGPASQTDDGLFVQGTMKRGPLSLFASAAGERVGDAYWGSNESTSAFLPILAIDLAVTPQIALHLGSVDALLPPTLAAATRSDPDLAAARSHLFDTPLGYDDRRRFRIALMAFRETIGGSASAQLGGSGVSAVWQVAPSLALRAWTLVARGTSGAAEPSPYQPPGIGADASPYAPALGEPVNDDRYVVWLTAGNELRVDAIARTGSIDGDVSVPIGARLRLDVGTSGEFTRRTTTIGIVVVR